MTSTKDLLVEIGTEELPAKHQHSLACALKDNLCNALQLAQLSFQEAKEFATPRRIAALISDVDSYQAGQKKEKLGPNISHAYDSQGSPTLACIGFARSAKVSVDQLEIFNTPKGKRVGIIEEVAGQASVDIFPDMIKQQIDALPISKPMRWSNNTFSFIRPVQWLVAMYGNETIPLTLFNLKSGKETRGHRFHSPKPLQIQQAKEYEARLYSQAYVVADFTKRREYIQRKLISSAGNNEVIIPNELLNEVTSLVEWPVILKGRFDPKYLAIPQEALIKSMQSHQKVFPIQTKQGKLLSEFLLVSNIESHDPALVIKGNEKVIRARLSDAEFFYNKDLKTTLDSHIKPLADVVFQQELGTLEDKTRRIAKLARYLSKQLNDNEKQATRAATLCKCDLLTEMVGEFPSLQGTMGKYYALANNEEEAVAIAIGEHYQPRFSQDELPQTTLGCIISISDKIDTLVGILGINLHPTGEKDPFGLRRAALSILKILIEKKLPIDLKELVKKAKSGYTDRLTNDEVIDNSVDFMQQRLKTYFTDKGISTNVFLAVNSLNITQPLDFEKRVIAVEHFQTLPEADALTHANKRVSNILKKQNKTPKKATVNINPKYLEEPAEKELVAALFQKIELNERLNKEQNYSASLTELASLKTPIDNFFENVMIMAESKSLQKNRLAIVQQIRQLFSQVADIAALS